MDYELEENKIYNMNILKNFSNNDNIFNPNTIDYGTDKKNNN